jgi:UDP-3-O-[3-hydroxymyristoyl] glucosamine N-acyltransferase
LADPRFFANRGPFPLGELARIGEADLVRGDPERRVTDVAALDAAAPSDLSFLDNKKYAVQARSTGAGACLVRAGDLDLLPEKTAALVTADPYRAYARIAAAFYPDAGGGAGSAEGEPRDAPDDLVHPEARLAPDCRIEPGAVVGAGAEIGARAVVGANAVVGRGVCIGEDSVVGAGATLSHCLIGKRVVLHPGVRIGQDGFGFALGPAGHQKVPQLGRVVIEDEVEIGANTTIDRGSGPDTLIGRGAKIDNLVMIAHNVQLGPGCVVVAQTGISGSTRIGAGSVLAAQVGVTGHLTIGPGTQLAARSAVIRDLEGGQVYGGAPAIPARDWRRQLAAISRLGKRKGGAAR